MTDPLLVRLVDEGRLEDTRRERERRRLLAGVAAEAATFVGTLADLAERGTTVSVRTRGGRAHVGSVELVGGDFTVVAGDGGQLWCCYGALTSLRSAGPAGVASGARGGLDLLLTDALALLVDDQPRLVFDLGWRETVVGELLAVGADVVTIGLDGGDVLYVPSASLDAVLRSG